MKLLHDLTADELMYEQWFCKKQYNEFYKRLKDIDDEISRRIEKKMEENRNG